MKHIISITAMATTLTLSGCVATTNSVKSDDLTTQCNAGDTNACFDLAGMYYLGNGIAQNLPKAAELTQRACNANHKVACNNLGIMYEKGQGVTANPEKALSLYEQSCHVNNGPSCYNAALIMKNFALPSSQTYRQYLQKACDLKLSKACDKLNGEFKS